MRVERSADEAQVFPYQHLVTASLSRSDDGEVLRLAFSSHDVEIAGRNLRPLLLAVQDFAVKWIRAVPERYRGLADSKNGVVTTIRIEEVK